MASSTQIPRSSLPRTRRLKTSIACHSCRSRKVKCDGVRPACGNCQKKHHLRRSCTYISQGASQQSPLGHSSTTVVPTAGPSAPRSPPATRSVPPLSLEPPAVTSEPPAVGSGQQGRSESQGIQCPGVFAGDVKAAIDERLGLSSGEQPILTPMSDAPLFGLHLRHQAADNGSHHSNNVLPPRKHADYLMDMYWRYIQPLEPFLDPERFSHSYKALFAGTPLGANERIFISTLNTVFALSTQLQETIQYEERQEASGAYFHRAWALLRPEAIIWEAGSLELVQCLLLMSRYLQCTSNAHQSRIAVSCALRIAETLGLHIPGPSSTGPPHSDNRLRQQVWQCCVFVDRTTSWGLGRPSTAFLSISSTAIQPPHDNTMGGEGVVSAHYFPKTLELYEISNQFCKLQDSCNGLADELGLPRAYHTDDPLSVVTRFDTYLNKWEKNLPAHLRLDYDQNGSGDVSHRQRLVLRLRSLHARIFLLRPILARFCLSQPEMTSCTSGQCLKDRILHDCASICVNSAQEIISLTYELDETIRALPWWYRIFYFHISAVVLTAAKLRSDLFTPEVSQSWNMLMSALHAHEHLGPFVQQCVAMFQTLSNKITATHNPGGCQVPQSEGNSNNSFQDILHGMGFEGDNFLFGLDDVSWLSNYAP